MCSLVNYTFQIGSFERKIRFCLASNAQLLAKYTTWKSATFYFRIGLALFLLSTKNKQIIAFTNRDRMIFTIIVNEH